MLPRIKRTRRFSVYDVASAPAPAPAPAVPAATAPVDDDNEARAEQRATHERLVARLRGAGIAFRQSTHAPTRTSQESAAVRGATLASGAKAMLMLAGGKGGNEAEAVLCVLSAAKKLDWKKLKKVQKGLRLATEEEVWAWTGCVPGAVPPFGSVFAPRLARTVMDVSIRGTCVPDGGFVCSCLCMGGAFAAIYSVTRETEQGDTINFNAGLRTESVHMTVVDFVELEQPTIADIAAAD